MANGNAYALLTCDDLKDKDRIIPEMSAFREAMSTPSGLELTLVTIDYLRRNADVLSKLSIPYGIFEEAQRMSRKGAKYLLKATCPDLPHEKTAGEVASLLTPAAYEIPGLDGNIYFKDDSGAYKRWE